MSSVNMGVAAHITAAAPQGARYDPSLSKESRSAFDNGIWLCQQCSRLVDADVSAHGVSTLLEWKAFAEAAAFVELRGYDVVRGRSFQALERKLPELIGEMRADIKEHPFTRELVILSRKWSYNPGPKPFFTYYLEDHSELLSKTQICENFGAIYNVKFNDIERYNLTEEFVEYLLDEAPWTQGATDYQPPYRK